jgi:hypothetical protein
MSKNTVKPGLTPARRSKRPKRTVEDSGFAAFGRRILRAYARRVAGGGNVEALREMAQFQAEVDAMMRTAVQGLRHLYSWQEIADRLGTTRQAAQMRYGEARRGVLDRRLVEAGMTVPVSTLVAVFADHHPGHPPASRCPCCGFTYPGRAIDCPTNAVVRPVLYRRRGEDRTALARLTPDQFADLHTTGTSGTKRGPARPAARSAPVTDDEDPGLFDPTGLTGKAGLR